jgi:hypothetical protein
MQKLRRLIAEKLSVAPTGSPRSTLLLRLLELSDIELLDEIYSRVDPNPDRIGCSAGSGACRPGLVGPCLDPLGVGPRDDVL